MKKTILIVWAVVFCVLLGNYFLDPNRMDTLKVLQAKGAQTGKDYMLSSLNVTAFARDKRELMWIGTSAGINVFDGKDYIQFYHDTKDTTALPDDYINVLHLDKQGRMWVGTQNGLARYVGAYRFHRIVLPDEASGNIVAIEDAKPSDLQPNKGKDTLNERHAVLVSNGKKTYLINDDDQVTEAKRQIVANNMKVPLPETLPVLRKPRDIVIATYRDLGGNLWVGFRNAGYQIISQNRIAYQKANDNPLAKTTAGKDIISLEQVGHHILAGTTLCLYVYDAQNKNLSETFYRSLFDSLPVPHKLAVNYLVKYDDKRAWVIGSHQILSCYVDDDKPEIVSKTPLEVKGFSSLSSSASSPSHEKLSYTFGYGVKVGNDLYVSNRGQHLLRFQFGKTKPDSLWVGSKWYDDETQLTVLRSGDLFLFMKNMHLGILSPKTGKWQELKVSGIPDYTNIDPAFVRQDSYGGIWLGTKRYGLYYLDMKKRNVRRLETLNDVHIQGFMEDNRGQLWVTTMRDAFCLNPKTRAIVMNSLVSASQDPAAWQFFDNSICLAPNGDVVFGSSDGCKFLSAPAMNADFLSSLVGKHAGRVLSIYGLEAEKSNGKVMIVNQNVVSGSRYTFAHDENTVRLRFFHPNYSRRSALMYQYKLEELDDEWRQPTYDHEAEFQDLAPGKYTFRLRLVSSPDRPPLQERKVDIIILPSPWQSAAAWYLYLSIAFFIIYRMNSLYLKNRKNQLRLLQEQREKEREIRANEMNMNFFANISHEFRNPITIIAGPLIALTSDRSLPASVHETLNHVCISVNRMLRLIDQMLDFNQLETDALRLKVSQVDVADELRKQVAAFEESTKVKNIKLELVMAEGDYRVWIDSDKLEKILSNLFTNALKHTSPQGVIRISAKIEKSESLGGIQENALPNSPRLEIAVFNSGEHISEEKMQDVFKRYYQLADKQTTHRYGWGTGIGLYYVKRLVGLHHGEIEVRNVFASEEKASEEKASEEKASDAETTVLDGVEFHFVLPVDKSIYNKVEIVDHEEKVMQIPLEVKSEERGVKNSVDVNSDSSDQSDGHKPSDEHKKKILIVDDDIDVAQYISSIFKCDYIIENRYSAEEALADLEQVKPDIILSDIIMGEMSGYDFCKTIKNNLMFSHIPVILITAKSNMDEQVQGLRLGAVAYVTKPFDPSYLKALVESQLQNVQTLRQRLGETTETESLSASVADTLSEQDRKFMDELYDLMEKRSAEMELNVSTICHDLLISQSKFNYKLKELTGETPGSFFRKYKLNKAARMLHEGKYNVSEIATLTGFSTAAHFSVAFKKQFGVSPSEYLSSLSLQSRLPAK